MVVAVDSGVALVQEAGAAKKFQVEFGDFTGSFQHRGRMCVCRGVPEGARER